MEQQEPKPDSPIATLIFVLVLLGFLLATGWATLSCVERTRDAWRHLDMAPEPSYLGIEVHERVEVVDVAPTRKEVFNTIMLGVAMARAEAPDASVPEDAPTEAAEHMPSSDDEVMTPPTKRNFCDKINEIRGSNDTQPYEVENFVAAMRARGFEPSEVCTSENDLATIRRTAHIRAARHWLNALDTSPPLISELDRLEHHLIEAGAGYEDIGRDRRWAETLRQDFEIKKAEFMRAQVNDTWDVFKSEPTLTRYGWLRVTLEEARLSPEEARIDPAELERLHWQALISEARDVYIGLWSEPSNGELDRLDDLLRQADGTYDEIPTTPTILARLRAIARSLGR